MSSDSRSNKKQQNAFDALDALAGGDEPVVPPEAPAPPAKPTPKPAAKPPSRPAQPPVQSSGDAPVEIPKVPQRPTQPPAGSGRPDTPPAVKKAPKATPARAVSRAAAPAAAAKPRAAAAPGQRTRRLDPVKVKRRIAARKQAEGWRQTAFPILMTIGLLLVSLGIVGLAIMPSKTFDAEADTDNWDTDPNSPLAKPAIRYFTYASFPIGAVVILGGILLVVQAVGLKRMRMADELALNGPPEEQE